MVTHKNKTFGGIWKMTKENTYYGYRLNENYYQWYKTKRTVLKRLKGTKREILRATLIGDEMYINLHYLTLMGW